MLSTKIRTTLIALAAVASIGGSSILPASSQAQPMTPWELGVLCDSLQFQYNQEVEKGVKAGTEGRYAEAISRFVNAEDAKNAAKFNGCKWAFSTLAPVSTVPVAVSPSRIGLSAKA